MTRLNAYRFLVAATLIALLEVLCLAGVIDKITMQPPHQIGRDLWRMLASGSMNGAIRKTLGNSALACAMAVLERVERDGPYWEAQFGASVQVKKR